jgi:outer membrane protein assembly factor BamB
MNGRSHFAHHSFEIILICASAIFMMAGCSARKPSHFQVLTRNYDNQRTGANVSEKTLKPSNVNSQKFGKVFMLPVDDQIYAGLLFVPDLAIAGRKHNVLYVATVNNSVYAFDADRAGDPLWHRNFNGSGRPTDHSEVGQACRIYNDFIGKIGIVGTPVIAPDRTMYFVSRTVESGSTVQRLHAIDITIGAERPNSPKVIQASIPGTGEGAVGPNVVFNPLTHNQRSALAYSDGAVYVAWASFCDTRPYHGWMMSFDPATLEPIGIFNASPNGDRSGIWMSGAAPGFDSAGNLYVGTGNGSYDGKTEFGESVLKLQAKSLRLLDFFTPSSFNTLNEFDLDFGSQGPTMLPDTNLFVIGGKESKLYLLNAENLGKQAPGDIQIPQVLQPVEPTIRPTLSHHLHNSNPVWKNSQGLNLYVWGENDFLQLFRFDPSTRKFVVPAAARGLVLPPSGMPGGMMTVSAKGTDPQSGILWAALPRAGDANQMTVPGVLYAFNANNLDLLWSSTGTGDDPLNFAKGSPPLVANGKVYVSSISNFVSVYGMKKKAPTVQNLALKRQAAGSAPCDPSQTPDKAFNGSAESGPADKWCSSAANPSLTVDLGSVVMVGRFVVEHAGAGGDDFLLNTRDFNIQLSSDGANFNTVANVTGNIQSITTHDIQPTTARYVRLNVITPAQITSPAANIYEFQIFAPPGSVSKVPDTLSALQTGTTKGHKTEK